MAQREMPKGIVPIGTPFELVVEDEIVAAWADLNNTFAARPGWTRQESYWTGFVFQVGRYQKADAFGQTDRFHSVEFVDASGATVFSIPKADFETNVMWVDIVPKLSNANPASMPMHVGHLRDLLVTLNPGTLRNYFEPYPGAVTLWQRRDEPMTITAAQSGNLHNRVTFRLTRTDEFKVLVYRGKLPFKDLSDANITKVILRAEDNGGGDDDRKNPPQMGGGG